MDAARLGPQDRAAAVRRMASETFDVVVIGGGVTGAGAALDAATRGLSVALLESADLASGTSSRSGKILHGGLRYLEQRNFKLVREAAHERNLSIERLCPHLAQPVRFLFPLTHRGWERVYMGAGVLLYDLLGGARNTVPRHRHLSRRRALREFPGLDPSKLTGAVQYYDGAVDDARHTLFVARTAARYGALVATQLEVVDVLRAGDRVVGVRARDHETGEELEVGARCVISATGAWTDAIQRLAGDQQVEIAPAKGVHLLVGREAIDAHTGLIARTADSIIAVRPWGEHHWLLGTTDTPWRHDPSQPVATAQDVDYLLGVANEWLTRPLTRADVVGVYVGVRPLVKGRVVTEQDNQVSAPGEAEEQVTAALSRDHAVLAGPPGLLTIVGGKYTTYRRMAQDVVDAAAELLGGAVPPSVTATTPLLGARGFEALRNQPERLAREAGLDPARIGPLLGRYGSLVFDLFALIADRPELGRPLDGAPEYLEVEVVYAASHEGARHLGDVLARRTRIIFEYRDRGMTAAGRVAELMGEVLGWGDAERAGEVERYATEVRAAQRAQAEPTDDAAFAAYRAVIEEAQVAERR